MRSKGTHDLIARLRSAARMMDREAEVLEQHLAKHPEDLREENRGQLRALVVQAESLWNEFYRLSSRLRAQHEDNSAEALRREFF